MSVVTEMTIRDLLSLYLETHEIGVRESSVNCWLKPAISGFEKFLGRKADLSDLTVRVLNKYIDWMKSEGSLHTAKARKGAIQSLANFAASQELIRPIGRLRAIKIIHGNPTGWTAEEVQKLMLTCFDESKSPYSKYRILPNGIDRGQYLGTLIALLWDTAFRLGDAFSLSWSDLRKNKDGTFKGTIVMSKTEKTHSFSIKPETVALLRTMKDCLKQSTSCRDKVLPEAMDRSQLYRMVKAYVAIADITPGTLRFIRRGAASTAESIERGAGKALLGHRSDWVANVSYLDQNIVGTKPIELPTISDIGPQVTYKSLHVDQDGFDEQEYNKAALIFSMAWDFAKRNDVTADEVAKYEKAWKPNYSNMMAGCLNLYAPTMAAFLPDGTMIGYAECFDEFGSLPWVFVHPRYRRRGIGTELAFRLNRELDRGAALYCVMEVLGDDWVSPWIQEFLDSAGFVLQWDKGENQSVLKMAKFKEAGKASRLN